MWRNFGPSGYGPPGSFLAPVADLGYFRMVAKKFGLEEDWITNGFDSSHFLILDPMMNVAWLSAQKFIADFVPALVFEAFPSCRRPFGCH